MFVFLGSADTATNRCAVVLLLLINILINSQPFAVKKGIDFAEKRMHFPNTGPVLREGDHVASYYGDRWAVPLRVVGS